MEDNIISQPLYREVQRFRQPWFRALILAISLISLWSLVQQIFLGQPFGNNPAPDWAVILIALVFGLGLPVLAYIVNLVTEVRNDGIYLRFFPFHSGFRKIALGDIEGYEPVDYNPIREYGGWGIRYGRKGKAYNVSGSRGVRLTLTRGKPLLIGSATPEKLAGALDTARKGK